MVQFNIVVVVIIFPIVVDGLTLKRNVEPGPMYPPTQGEVWPKPQFENKETTFYNFRPSQFQFQISAQTCDILSKALDRYQTIINDFNRIKNAHQGPRSRRNKMLDLDKLGSLKTLRVELTAECESDPHYEMDEKYNLTINDSSFLTSGSIWGILRGLETFVQLFYFKNKEIRINTTSIFDYPQYKHRGLLIDTGRHFLTKASILKTLDALAMNKMNVLHWHITDDQSFPYVSDVFPTLSKKGAFAPSLVYTQSDIQEILQYARYRGIRVIPEFDVPGHTRSWGATFPTLLTPCYEGKHPVSLGPLNPLHNKTYSMLQQLYLEIDDVFPDDFLHIGGDEVDFDCWESNPEIQKYLIENNSSAEALHAHFMRRVLAMLPPRYKTIVWQEVFDEGAVQHPTFVQVWRYEWTEEMVKVLRAGHSVIFSAAWYLDYLKPDWALLYSFDPRRMVFEATGSAAGLERLVGGEACMWGEKVDDHNLMTRVWPRASAVAERLWTGLNYTSKEPVDAAHSRIEEHWCRMNRRGIPAEPPNGPGYCVGAL